MGERRARITIIGAGSWGTTLSLLVSRAGHQPTLYVRDPEQAAAIARSGQNERYLPGIDLPPELSIATELDAACNGAEMILLVVPSQAMRETARAIAPLIRDALVLSAAKGLERGSLLRMTDVVSQELPGDAVSRICALSGPNLALEIAHGKPAASVVAGPEHPAARARDLMMSAQFRCYTSADVVGVEMGGALKNIIAIGAGMADGLDAGDNAKAAFMTRGIAEIGRLGLAVGANPLTFAGLAGLGDLVATCASPLSRNYRLGRELAKGRPLPEILEQLGQVAEGVFATETAAALGRRYGVELPITEQLAAILFEGKPALAAIRDLMQRDAKDELDWIRLGQLGS
jgi:glycerol-3-phosphate dehydrogenase (NAD(P)+)